VIGPDLFALSDLWRHYRTCRRNKRNTRSALNFEFTLEGNLLALQAELRGRSYRPGTSICFLTDGPKPREVFAADFRDRIVHHLLVSHQERVFEPIFIHDSYACRRGKGTLAASTQAMQFLRAATANGQCGAWAMKLDVASFFPSVHKPTLFEILTRRVRHPTLIWLTEVLLFHDPTEDYDFRSKGRRVPPPRTPGYPISPQKSLFEGAGERGLPIGNLTSQFWGNVYLNELDQFVKRELRVRHYVRYVDDMLLLSRSRAELIDWREKIGEFLEQRLRLRLRADMGEPERATEGIDFVGWRTWPTRRAVRRRTLESFDRRLATFEGQHVHPALDGLARRIDLDRPGTSEALRQLRATLASTSGHLCHGSVADWARVLAARGWLEAVFERSGWSVEPRWPAESPVAARSFGASYAALMLRLGQRGIVFLQVGRFIEFYGLQRLLALRVLGLRSVGLPRGGFALLAGFPCSIAWRARRAALSAGLYVLEVERRRAVPAGAIGGDLRIRRLWVPSSVPPYRGRLYSPR